ncbi:uncharacterized protein LOC113234179 isoform X2 [Hyposmocoma kahamanoa]|uniref:uncharacterized protein LOC113234179 isoform X2 n=1 Tax=Hyposmocoma kahamanoa TaxID=1477025 RepID=UPI000E6D9B4B|nr:uncharacterized protein LOC113234179 isoform X2 [Hyposmocoma kahamanoa]
MPSSFSFYKYIKANKEDELPPPKPQSSVLEWKFINKNTPYSYILLMGAGVILVRVIVYHRDMLESARNWFRFFKDMSFVGSTFVICIFGVIFCNVMSSIGAAIIYLPSVIVEQTDYPHLSALAAGLSCTFGYMAPFLNTPAYFSKTIGKVPLQYLIMYNVGSSLISTCVLWAMIVALGPSVFPIK